MSNKTATKTVACLVLTEPNSNEGCEDNMQMKNASRNYISGDRIFKNHQMSMNVLEKNKNNKNTSSRRFLYSSKG